MRLSRAVLAIALAACGKGHGLLVQTEPGAELFVALQSDDCAAGTSCPIAPPLATDRGTRGPTRSARRWLIADLDPIVVDSTGGWLFEADGSKDQRIAALLAVQVDAHGAVTKFALAHDLAVPASGRAIVKLELHAPNGDGVQLWRTQDPTDAQAPCALVTTGQSAQPYESFSRPADQDCDAAMPECDKYGVFGNVPANDSSLTCVFEATTTRCELGGMGCMDNVPTGTVCQQPEDPWCLATAVCAPIANCRGTGDACLPAILHSVQALGTPVLHCTFPQTIDGLPCPGELPLMAMIDLSPIGPDCAEAKVAGLGAPLMWDAHTTLTPDGTFTINNFNNNECTIAATVTEPKAAGLRAAGLIEIKTKASPPIHHVIPLVITHEGADCNAPSACGVIATADAADSLFTCRP